MKEKFKNILINRKKIEYCVIIISFMIILFPCYISANENESAQNKLVQNAVAINPIPTPVILDVDMCTDTDDMIAVRIIQEYDKQGFVDFKALMLSVENDLQQGKTACEGILDAYNTTDVWVGTSSSGIIETKLPYWGWLSSNKKVEHYTDIAVRQYRRILSTNNNVVIIITGHFDNLWQLIKSQPDDISNETGLQLIQEHVKFFDICGVWKGKTNGYTGFENNTCYYSSSYIASSNFYEYIGKIGVPIYQYAEDGTLAGNIIVGGKDQLDKDDVVYKAFNGANKYDGGYSWDAICAWTLLPILTNNFELYGMNCEQYMVTSTWQPSTRFKSIPDVKGNVTMMNMTWNPKTYKLYIDDSY